MKTALRLGAALIFALAGCSKEESTPPQATAAAPSNQAQPSAPQSPSKPEQAPAPVAANEPAPAPTPAPAQTSTPAPAQTSTPAPAQTPAPVPPSEPTPPAQVDVPKLTGLSFNEAQQALQKLDLAAVRRDVVNNSVSAGQVFNQSPPPSAKVAPKATVMLLVAKQEEAPALVEVPKLTGMSFNEAQQLLQRIGLAAARNDAVNNTIAAGQVMAQTPAAAAKIAPRGTVTLIVAKHEVPPPPPAAPFVDFAAPQVRGMALDICREWGVNCGKPAADAFCVAQGFAGATDFRTQQDSPPSRVISTGQICKEKFCDRISWVRCAKTPTQAKRMGLRG